MSLDDRSLMGVSKNSKKCIFKVLFRSSAVQPLLKWSGVPISINNALSKRSKKQFFKLQSYFIFQYLLIKQITTTPEPLTKSY